MRMCTNTSAVDARPKFFAYLSFRRVKYTKNFGLGTRPFIAWPVLVWLPKSVRSRGLGI